jgi:hypothetical protein
MQYSKTVQSANLSKIHGCRRRLLQQRSPRSLRRARVVEDKLRSLMSLTTWPLVKNLGNILFIHSYRGPRLIIFHSLEDLKQWCYRTGSDARNAELGKIPGRGWQNPDEFRTNSSLPQPYRTANGEKVISEGMVWYPEEPLEASQWSKTIKASIKAAGVCTQRMASQFRRYIFPQPKCW